MDTAKVPNNSIGIDKLEELYNTVKDFGVSVSNGSDATETNRTQRIYDVIVYNRDNEPLDFYNEISAQYAGRIRNEARRNGNHVHQIEVSNLSGKINPVEFTPPTAHHSNVTDKPDISIATRSVRDIRASAKFQQMFFAKANTQLKQVNDIQNLHILVYDKMTSKLCFSGNFSEAAAFIINKMKSGEWTPNSWVIYLTKKLYDKVAKDE